MGIATGAENLQWLFTGTFITTLAVVPVFGFVTKRCPRRKFLPGTYFFLIANILVFFILFKIGVSILILAPVFFIWISVFNLFIVSVFWSFMVDIFTTEQSKRLFGIISAGGSAGAICGPAIAAFLVNAIGPVNLLLIAIGLLLMSVWCIKKLISQVQHAKENHPVKLNNIDDRAIGGSIFAGIKSFFQSKYLMGIGTMVIFYTTVSTFLYFEQAHIVEEAFNNSSSRTSYFALVDLITNTIAITAQFFLTGRIIKKFGLAIALALIPFLVMIGFSGLSLITILPVLVVVQVIHKAGNFSLLRPGREILFTLVSHEDRYKAKNFIDTVLYRGSDAVVGWAFAGLVSFGLSLPVIALLVVPIAGLWSFTGFSLGNKKLKAQKTAETKVMMT